MNSPSMLTLEQLREKIAALRADIENQRKRAARINSALEPRVKALNRLLADLALREASATRTHNER